MLLARLSGAILDRLEKAEGVGNEKKTEKSEKRIGI
jgi:hypothetical protein